MYSHVNEFDPDIMLELILFKKIARHLKVLYLFINTNR